jgi:hypothetical protein
MEDLEVLEVHQHLVALGTIEGTGKGSCISLQYYKAEHFVKLSGRIYKENYDL